MVSVPAKFFECQKCGQCCEKLGLSWPSYTNLVEMAKFLNTQIDNIIERYYGKIVEKDGKKFIKKYKEDRRTPCPFLGGDKTCKIYPVRPDPCRAYPLYTDFGRCGIDCPGMKTHFMRQNHKSRSDDMTYSLDLLFLKPSKGQLLFPPFAQIYIKTYTSDENGRIFITPQCVNFKEVEEQIDRLKEELETIRKKAKQKFANIGR